MNKRKQEQDKEKQEKMLESYKVMKINNEINDQQQQQQQQNKSYEKLFKLIFCNVVILRKIYYQIKLSRNYKVIFGNRKQLLNFKSRQFITKIVYRGREDLQIGDLPIDGVLKHVVIEYVLDCPLTDCIVIPNGVEILDLVQYIASGKVQRILKLDNLPTTCHTVNGIFSQDAKIIPSSITSISFLDDPFRDMSSSPFDTKRTDFSIPKGIKQISLPNSNILNGDIPEGIEKLMIKGKVGKLSKSLLPNSIKELHLNCDTSQPPKNYKSYEADPDLPLNILNLLPPNVEILNIDCPSLRQLKRDLSTCTLIKDLTISTGSQSSNYFENAPLPPNLTKLSLIHFNFNIEQGLIPKTVTDLCLRSAIAIRGTNPPIIRAGSLPNGLKSLEINQVIDEPNILPESLTHLSILAPFSNENVDKFISILPLSLTSIIIPGKVFNMGLKFPDTIKKIDYTATDLGQLKSELDSTIVFYNDHYTDTTNLII